MPRSAAALPLAALRRCDAGLAVRSRASGYPRRGRCGTSPLASVRMSSWRCAAAGRTVPQLPRLPLVASHLPVPLISGFHQDARRSERSPEIARGILFRAVPKSWRRRRSLGCAAIQPITADYIRQSRPRSASQDIFCSPRLTIPRERMTAEWGFPVLRCSHNPYCCWSATAGCVSQPNWAGRTAAAGQSIETAQSAGDLGTRGVAAREGGRGFRCPNGEAPALGVTGSVSTFSRSTPTATPRPVNRFRKSVTDGPANGTRAGRLRYRRIRHSASRTSAQR
jgi:hypothetical protein